MKHFILKLLAIVAVGIWLIVVIIGMHWRYYCTKLSNLDFTISDSIDTVLVGNSCIECAIDDALLPGVLNWAQSGNRPGVTYFKLRKLFEANRQIRYVFCSFGPHVYNEKDKNKFPGGLLQILPFMSIREIISLRFPLSVYSGLIPELMRAVRSQHYPVGLAGYGAYLNLDRLKLDEDIRLREHQPIKTFSDLSPYYQRMVELCQQHGVTLIFLQTPVYQRSRYYGDVSWLKGKFLPTVEYWDFGDFVLPRECYGDVLHLNRQGALLFTPLFGQKLDKLRLTDKMPGNRALD